MRLFRAALWCLCNLALVSGTLAAERHLGNARRTGYTPESLSPPYHLAWEYRALQPPRPAWREPGWEPQRIDFDYAFPIASDANLVYVASSADHALRALDRATGELRWTFFTDGPLRLAPEIASGRLFFGSDDGYVYCLEAATGYEIWRFRPALPDERLLGNEQVISRWPTRSGVVVAADRVYTTFGMLSPEGIYVCCLKASDGTPVWINDTSGTRYTTRPHVPGMGGVSPQGYLVLDEDVLAVTCGRAPPALFDRHTGALLYHEAEGDFTGGAWCMAADGLVITPCESLQKEYGSLLRRETDGSEAAPFATASLVALDHRTGREVFTLIGGHRAVVADDGSLTLAGADGLRRVNLAAVRQAIGKETTIKHTVGHFVEASKQQVWQAPEAGVVYALLQAGETILAGGRGVVSAYAAATGQRLWTAEVEGQARELAVGNGQLLVSTTAGRVYCFAPGAAAEPPRVHAPEVVGLPDRERYQAAARRVLADSGVTEGTCVTLGASELPFLAELARQSQLVISRPVPPGDLSAERQALAAAGLYGSRIVLHQTATDPLPYAPYLADLVVAQFATPEDLQHLPAAELFRILRPYGGVADLRFPEPLRPAVESWLAAGGGPATGRTALSGGLRIVRGALEGAGEWTHQYADPGKSAASSDQLARLPLQALWFGGPGPDRMVSRHFRAPAPLVVNGRCFISGTDCLIAMCIYTGRTLWQRELPDLAHWPAAYRGPAVAADHSAVYALRRLECLRLDPATGETLATFAAPVADPADEAVIWEYLAVAGQYLVGTLGHPEIRKKWWSLAYPDNRLLFALDKETGALAWQYRPRDGVDSNAIAVADGRVYLIDGLVRHPQLRRKPDANADYPPRVLRALDLASGSLLWETADVAPTHNSVWTADGVVLTTIQPYSRAMEDPPVAKVGGGARAYAGATGKPLWQVDELQKCSPVLANGIAHFPAAYDLQTGRPVLTPDPLTGKPVPYVPDMPRACSVLCGSPNLIMSRSGSLGFYDLQQRNITYYYPVLRASCWINMIPAGGLVVVPEGSSSCVCAYNYKASMALVHAERQDHYGLIQTKSTTAATTLRLNLGAPGDRYDSQGAAWFAWPRPTAYGRPLCHAVYGPKVGGVKDLPVASLPDSTAPETVACYADELPAAASTMPWLDACGLRLPLSLRVRLDTASTRRYRVTVRLRSATDQPGAVTLVCQGKVVAEALTIGPTAQEQNCEVEVPEGELTLSCQGGSASVILTGLATLPLAP